MVSKERQAASACASCGGTGEMGTGSGVVDCPDCGGSGQLPNQSVLVEWRVRDIERVQGEKPGAVGSDVRFLVTELRRARKALTEVVALSQEPMSPEIAKQIRLTAGEALSIYEVIPVDSSKSAS